jgi:uncharacterized iron-regulated protein
MRLAATAVAAALVGACAPARSQTAPSTWQSTLDRGHPLAGRIWDVAVAQFVDESVLAERVRSAPYVAVGEQHDNPDHHRLEARLVDVIADAGKSPRVVFEMIDAAEQAKVDHALAASPRDPDALARAVDWAHSGWPPWPLYRPVFDAAVHRGLAVVGGGMARSITRRLVHEGTGSLDADFVDRFGLGAPLDTATGTAMRSEMSEAHCGLLPEAMLDPMVLVQRAKDAELAAHWSAGGAHGGVLIAGNGHVRNDRGAPAAFRRVSRQRLVTVALMEVRAGVTMPAKYAEGFDAERLPFDYVWFTPRVSDADHCNDVRKGK